MNAEQIEQLRRRMGELATLPHDDPQRQALVQQISEVNGALEREWLELIHADEQLRIDLARVTPPPGLEERLLAIPGQAGLRGRWTFRPSHWLSALAAVLVIAVALWGLTSVKEQRVARAIDLVATVTMASHASEPELDITSSDWKAIVAASQQSVHYPLDLPTLDPSLRLTGAKVIELAGNTMLYTRWEHGSERYSLYQFCGKDFGLKRPLPRQELKPSPKADCSVIVWTENHCDYALVIEESLPASEPAQRSALRSI
jgi:hypothetical protein